MVKEAQDKYVYIPLLDVLANVLKCPRVYEEIVQGHTRSDNIVEDFCDSPKVKNHPLFSKQKHSLQIILYFDELELCNPLGSFRKKHKLGCYYYTLGNISPMYRSSLKSIFLLCLVENPILNLYGHDKILETAVIDIKQLEEGVMIETCEGIEKFYGTIATVCGDNPGTAAVAGFKESASAKRCCRQCLGTKEEFNTLFHESHFTLRTPRIHNHYCGLLTNPELRDLHDHYSVTYGVNRDSILNDLQYFHTADETIPPDLLHDMLEGYLPYKVKLMLQNFFSLLNSRNIHILLAFITKVLTMYVCV
ncbi:uncharacterized protein [Dysidea avara]